MAAYEISLRANTSPVALLLTLRMIPKEPCPILSKTSNSDDGSPCSTVVPPLPARLVLDVMLGVWEMLVNYGRFSWSSVYIQV